MWGAIIEIAIKLLGFVLDRSSASAELKRQFMKLVLSMQSEGLVSGKVSSSYEKQLEDLKKRRQERGDQ